VAIGRFSTSSAQRFNADHKIGCHFSCAAYFSGPQLIFHQCPVWGESASQVAKIDDETNNSLKEKPRIG
jgi:hypothetical protein